MRWVKSRATLPCMLKTSDFGHFDCINNLAGKKKKKGEYYVMNIKKLYGIWLYPSIKICLDVLVTVADVQFVLGLLCSYLINLLW